jgi:hypothetical protein
VTCAVSWACWSISGRPNRSTARRADGDGRWFGRQATDRRKVAAVDKAVAVLDRRDAPAPCLALDPFVTVQDHLRAKRRSAAHPDGDVTPLPIDRMKEEMPDIGESFASGS